MKSITSKIGLLLLLLLCISSAYSAIERTLSIIKPDATERNLIGKINTRFEENGLKIIAIKMISITPEQAGQFYYVHKDKPFFEGVKTYMASGPIVVQVLEGENAIELNRKIMGGAADPKKATPGSIRADYGLSIGKNTVHGSDSPQSAAYEVKFFFNDLEIH